MPDSEPISSPPPPKVKTTVGRTRCCGMAEINNLSASDSPKEALLDIVDNLGYGLWGMPFIIFTGVVELSESKRSTKYVSHLHPVFRDSDYGAEFAKFIVENGLGTVVESAPRKNPFSSNILKVWIWQPEYDALKPYVPKPNVAGLPNG